jgi:hypothetical protein
LEVQQATERILLSYNEMTINDGLRLFQALMLKMYEAILDDNMQAILDDMPNNGVGLQETIKEDST